MILGGLSITKSHVRGSRVQTHNGGFKPADENYTPKFCQHFACKERHAAHGWCKVHNERVKKYGNPYTYNRRFGSHFVLVYELYC